MKKIMIFIFLTLIFVGSTHAAELETDSPERAFYRANIAYEAGEYDKAIGIYKSLLSKGLSSSSLFYNLGNAYFKKGEIGEAILNYKRAKWLSPTDSDITSNYFHAMGMMKRKDSVDSRFILLQWLDNGSQMLTVKQLTLIFFILFYILAAYTIMAKIFKVFPVYSNQVIIIFIVLLGVVLTSYIQRSYAVEHEAIVLDKITDARFEPINGATVHFPLYEGMKVYILRSKEGWDKIKRPDGKIGWVSSKSIEKVAI